MHASSRKPIIIWLSLCAVLVFAMVVVGGLTRLTESGLSIVEWKPVRGTLPPISAAAWEEEFAAYQTSPQYVKVNKGMSLEAFKGIFWLEFLHRLLGRLIGLPFFLPLLYFAFTKKIERSFSIKLTGIFLLGGLQGVVGWYMVQSGLIDLPMVSPYRLALHLGLAVILYGLILWQLLNLLPRPLPANAVLRRGAAIITSLVFIQIILGAFVAGLDAGLTYNTFPLMDGHFIPQGIGQLLPWYKNIFENIATVQFNHRMMAYLLVVAIVVFCCYGIARNDNRKLRVILICLSAVLFLQFLLGIGTLIYVVPVALASLHQACALLLFTLCIILLHGLQVTNTTLGGKY